MQVLVASKRAMGFEPTTNSLEGLYIASGQVMVPTGLALLLSGSRADFFP